MKATILWVVGEPGAGKTTLVRKMFNGGETMLIEKPKWTVSLGEKVVVLAGHYKGETFDGADTVPYNGVEDALEYWHQNYNSMFDLTIFDGDRFSNQGVVDFFKRIFEHSNAKPRLACLLLSGGPEIGMRRRARSQQDETWVKGRISKARNFFETFQDALEIHGSEAEMWQQAEAFLAGAPVKRQQKQSTLF